MLSDAGDIFCNCANFTHHFRAPSCLHRVLEMFKLNAKDVMEISYKDGECQATFFVFVTDLSPLGTSATKSILLIGNEPNEHHRDSLERRLRHKHNTSNQIAFAGQINGDMARLMDFIEKSKNQLVKTIESRFWPGGIVPEGFAEAEKSESKASKYGLRATRKRPAAIEKSNSVIVIDDDVVDLTHQNRVGLNSASQSESKMKVDTDQNEHTLDTTDVFFEFCCSDGDDAIELEEVIDLELDDVIDLELEEVIDLELDDVVKEPEVKENADFKPPDEELWKEFFFAMTSADSEPPEDMTEESLEHVKLEHEVVPVFPNDQDEVPKPKQDQTDIVFDSLKRRQQNPPMKTQYCPPQPMINQPKQRIQHKTPPKKQYMNKPSIVKRPGTPDQGNNLSFSNAGMSYMASYSKEGDRMKQAIGRSVHSRPPISSRTTARPISSQLFTPQELYDARNIPIEAKKIEDLPDAYRSADAFGKPKLPTSKIPKRNNANFFDPKRPLTEKQKLALNIISANIASHAPENESTPKLSSGNDNFALSPQKENEDCVVVEDPLDGKEKPDMNNNGGKTKRKLFSDFNNSENTQNKKIFKWRNFKQ